ncbi:GNAT family N-acetyltransferase [Paucibacter sp. APW11]|uniref:GNAT family N-acetyltransferase n=1 Tax=Roseateles aquae TaxID=3077235 RepID=A0ABU3P9X9_9BURK|nr:GNAT family N-acetyltransferase [Paucibacter sp. APW11]MDT8999381.1 GNAT family N-acetyltransferase [Paucibacter sp. APW11]
MDALATVDAAADAVMPPLRLMPVRQLDRLAFAPLLAAAEAEGLQMLRRLLDEWLSGAKRFDRPGESLWGLQDAEGRWVAVGGLNMEPAPGRPGTARMRRFYVLPALRGQGCGRRLLGAVLASAAGRFNRLHVNAQTAHAAAFWTHCGFTPVAESSAYTHVRLLPVAMAA